MESLWSIDWSALFGFSVSLSETIIRGTATYWFLFVMFRFILRRDIGALGIADVLFVVIVADASQNAMSGEYKTVSDGLALILTLIFWHLFVDWMNFHVAVFRRFAEPPPLPLIRDGRMIVRNLRRELITEAELWAKLRHAEVESLDQVKFAYMEADGEISVIRKT